jgi:hypothetical protein
VLQARGVAAPSRWPEPVVVTRTLTHRDLRFDVVVHRVDEPSKARLAELHHLSVARLVERLLLRPLHEIFLRIRQPLCCTPPFLTAAVRKFSCPVMLRASFLNPLLLPACSQTG